MSNLADVYTKQIHDNLQPLYANWDIATPRELGDYGKLDGSLFISLGNIKNDFGINVPEIEEERLDSRSFASKGNTDVSLTGQGQIPASGVTVNAKLEITFSESDAMFFNAAGCVYTMAQSKFRLGQDIIALKDKWDPSWVVVTDIVDSGAVTAAISSSRNASITFEADAHVPAINLADPKLSLTVSSSRNCSFQLAAPQGKNILLGFCGIRGFFNPGFGPVKAVLFDPKHAPMPTKVSKPTIKSTAAKTGPSPQAYFGQIP